jgi:hypothetical protein
LLPPLLPPLWSGFLVGLLVGGGAGGGAAVCGGGGGSAVGVGFCVGVFWVANAGAGWTAMSPDPDALCGHQATRQADNASIVATMMRTPKVLALLTTSS